MKDFPSDSLYRVSGPLAICFRKCSLYAHPLLLHESLPLLYFLEFLFPSVDQHMNFPKPMVYTKHIGLVLGKHNIVITLNMCSLGSLFKGLFFFFLVVGGENMQKRHTVKSTDSIASAGCPQCSFCDKNNIIKCKISFLTSHPPPFEGGGP